MALFFKPRHKAQKDRTILKRIDQTLSRQGLPSALSHFAFFLLIETLLQGQYPFGNSLYAFGLALIVMAAWRFIMIAQFESWYGRGPARWRDLFILSGFCHAAIWSFYLVYRLSQIGLVPELFIGLLYTAAIAAGGTFVYSLYGKTVRWYLLILLGPVVAFFLIRQSSTVDLVLGLGCLALYAYLVSTAKRVSDLIWSFLATNHEFKLRLSALEQAREATSVESSSNRRFIQQILLRVKNPLSGLLGVLSMLVNNADKEDNPGMLSIAQRSGYSMLNLITDLEAFIEQRDQTRVPQSMVFNLRKTLEHSLADMGVKAHENGRELSYLYDPGVPERIEADPQWLSNAFRRLLDFTIEMSDGGEITVKVGVGSELGKEYLHLVFYFVNSEIEASDLTLALERQMDVLPEDEDIADQLTLMVASAQFRAMGARLEATEREDLKRISVMLPFTSTSQQATSFRPAKYMTGKSILLVDLSAMNQRSLSAEFDSWQMAVDTAKLEELLVTAPFPDANFVLVNVPVDDEKARVQAEQIADLAERIPKTSHLVLYASELQRSEFKALERPFIFVEKPVARDQLLSSLRSAHETIEAQVAEVYRCDNARILVAEDNLLNQKVVLNLLENTGVIADTCTNGKEVIEKVAACDYQLILMDCYMPRMDGIAATRAIRRKELDSGKHIPIVAMTSDQSPEVERECLAAGMDDFLSKPLQQGEVIEVLQRWTAE